MSSKAIQFGPELVLPEHYAIVADLLLHAASAYPGKGMTYIDSSGEEQFESYPELLLQARLYLHRLQEKGLGRGQVVLLEIDQSREFYHVFWACMLGGIIAAPVSAPSAWEPGSTGLLKFTRVWEVLDKPVVIIEDTFRPHYEKLREDASFDGLELISVNELQHGENIANIVRTEPNDLIFLQFSSGSTGTPKGVQLTNHNIVSNSIAVKTFIGSQEGDTVFTWLPHTHDMGLFGQHLTPMASGTNIMVMSPYTFIRSPYLFLQKITEHRGKWFCCTNFGFDWMVQKVPEAKLDTLDLSSLRITLNGAEPISRQVIDRFTAKFARCGYRSNMMFPAYGMAEATVGVCTPTVGQDLRVERISRTSLVNEGLAIPVLDPEREDTVEFVHEGYPITGIQIRIADEYGVISKEREIGEIQIRGESVTSGYFNCPSLNKDTFVEGWLRTGDLGFMVDGSLVVSGRIKDIIFIRGQNHYAHDLEEVLYRGNEIPRGNLAVVGHFNGITQKEELLVFVKHKSNYTRLMDIRSQLVDRMRGELGIEITHVLPIKAIPKTTSGKVQRFVLQQAYANGDFTQDIMAIDAFKVKEDRQEEVTSGTLLERRIQEVWAEVLELPAKRITLDAPFLSLGGNSIRSYQLLDRLSSQLGRELGQEMLIFCKTVREMAEYIQEMPDDERTVKGSKADNSLNIHRAVAITGLALRLPDADTQEQFWSNLMEGKDSVVRVSPERIHQSGRPDWNEWMGELKNHDTFDHEFFEIPAEQASYMDPQHRKLLEVAHEALEDAGMLTDREDKRGVGVYVGINPSTYYGLVVDSMNKGGQAPLHSHAMVGNMSNIAAATISHLYNFTGPALAIDTACSSFLVALNQAVAAIRSQGIEGAVVGGATVLATPDVHQLSRTAGICSSTKHTKVFDRDADGSVIGEGAVVVYLEPLTSAIRNHKHIYGLIRGTAVNNDGYSLGIMAPNPQGQYEVLSEAYKDANLLPGEVSYIEAHGSGTRIGDPIEVSALTRLFSESGEHRTSSIGLGSVKTNIGHLFPASSGASLAKVLLSLKHKQLAPSLHMDDVNPALRLDQSPFYIVEEPGDWEVLEGQTRKAGISSFGLGGTNAHVVIEEWKPPVQPARSEGLQILTFSAKTKLALEKQIEQAEQYIREHPEAMLSDVCFTRNRYRKHYRYRAVSQLVPTKSMSIRDKMRFGYTPRIRAAHVGIMVGGTRGQGQVHEDSDGITPYWFEVLESITRLVPSVKDIRGVQSGDRVVSLLNQHQPVHGRDVKSSNSKSRSPMDIWIVIGAERDQIPDEISPRTLVIELPIQPTGTSEEQIADLLSQLYIGGAALDWKQIHPDGSGQMVHLPAYPFEPHKHWIHVNKETEVTI
ncbi:beta-ketoacyl synthase N-terminal-like domain-containing protein [Paenibacillus sp. QZ-Y1]|uniref:non-ribosomal peptide synthetase n=1 Tax=Paenibacillus sp. QZ-Y1 TaxID=3414511 RepID=UPI003F792E24